MKRRDFLKLSGVGGLAALSAGAIATTLANAPRGTFAPAMAAGATTDKIYHLINRLTFGVTPDLYDYVSTMGVDAYLEEQLAPDTIDDRDADALLEAFPLMQRTGGDLIQAEVPRPQVGMQLVGATMVRAVYSRRQLYERMVQFWGDHFYVFIQGGATLVYLKVDDDRNAIRPNALGTFHDILSASAHSPAMLAYLDNAQSRAEAPNENYGRELLELQTLGVSGGYTEADVKAVARAFTGWSMVSARDAEAGNVGTFLFRKRWHDPAAKTVLGINLPAGRGVEDGEAVLDILARHPSTARFVSTKLVRRFVADEPPTTLVTRCANAFLQSQGDIKTVLRTIFASEEFWNAPPRFKRPFDYTASLLRATGYKVSRGQRLIRTVSAALSSMGHVPFQWPAPNGYPDVGAYWINNLLPRWNTAIQLVEGVQGASPTLQAEARNTDTTIATWGRYLYGRDLTTTEQEIVADFSTSVGGNTQQQQQAALALLLAAPAFQYY